MGAGALAAPWCISSRVVEQHWRCYLCCEAIVIVYNTNVSTFVSQGGLSGPSFFGTQLSATDVSARTTMKGAAKCDKHCELQNSVNQQVFERILRFRDIPESMPASVSIPFHSLDLSLLSSCASVCALPW